MRQPPFPVGAGETLYSKKYKIWHKVLAKPDFFMYTSYCCDIDSDEARGCCPPWQVFRGANVKLGNWRQVTVQVESSTEKKVETTCDFQ